MDERDRLERDERIERMNRAGGSRDHGEPANGPKLSVSQWIQITALIVGTLTGSGIVLAHGNNSASPEFIQTRAQLDNLTGQVIKLQLEEQHMKDQIEYLEEVIRRSNK